MKIKKFTEGKNNENADATLYRLVNVPNGSNLVVNVKEPGKYYFNSEKAIDPSILKNSNGELHVIKVQTSNSNINRDESDAESRAPGKKLLNNIVVLNDPSDAKIISIEPYKKAA